MFSVIYGVKTLRFYLENWFELNLHASDIIITALVISNWARRYKLRLSSEIISSPPYCICEMKHVFVRRATWTSPTKAACGSAPGVPDLGLHRPAQLGSAHHPHCGPGLPCHGPQQDSYHWQDQVDTHTSSLQACYLHGLSNVSGLDFYF